MEEKEIFIKRFENWSREQLVDEIKRLEHCLDAGRQQFADYERRVFEVNQEIEFLRQVILNLTKK